MAVPPTTTGSGALTVDNNCASATGFVKQDTPEWDVTQGGEIHLNIEPDFTICTQGNTNLGDRCTTVSQCISGTPCNYTCTGGPNAGDVCANANDCKSTGTCTSNVCSNSNDPCVHDSDCTLPFSCSNSIPNPVKTCTAGSLLGNTCNTNNDCGTCGLALECDVTSNSNSNIMIQGHTGVACTSDSDCSGGTTCDTGSRCEGGNKDGSSCSSQSDCTGGGTCQVVDLCQFSDTVSGTGSTTKLCDGGQNDLKTCSSDTDCNGGSCVAVGKIDACYTTRDTSCGDAQVVYCGNKLGNITMAGKSEVKVTSILETTDASGNELDTAAACMPPGTCQNTVGSLCCGLSQGAYGAPNSIATSLGTGGNTNFCNNTNLGFIPAGQCDSCKVFAGLPNATTVGIFGTRSVTIGAGTDPSFLTDLATLEQELPAGGTPNKLSATIGAMQNYTSPSLIPDPTASGSKGQGGGSLTGQSMACGLNSFLSDCTPPFAGSSSFTTSGFDTFKLPGAGTLVCTKRAGADEVLGTGDDVCQAFLYPNCVAGLTVRQVKAAADKQLAGQSNGLGCSASALTQALDNINNQFESCGEVIDCGTVSSPGVFICP